MSFHVVTDSFLYNLSGLVHTEKETIPCVIAYKRLKVMENSKLTIRLKCGHVCL